MERSHVVKRLMKYLLPVCVLLLTVACPSPLDRPEPEINITTNDLLATLEAEISLGGVKFEGETQITFPQAFKTCSGRSTDVTLQMGSPRPDGLIRSELTVLVDYRWDSDCSEIHDGSYSFLAYGLYDPKTKTVTFDECAGQLAQGSSVLNGTGFKGTVECFTEEEKLWYQLDFAVSLPNF
jgi:hypothetical protein